MEPPKTDTETVLTEKPLESENPEMAEKTTLAETHVTAEKPKLTKKVSFDDKLEGEQKKKFPNIFPNNTKIVDPTIQFQAKVQNY